MQHENNTSHNKPPVKKPHSTRVPLSQEEIEYLKAKRFIDEWDVMRFFCISRSTLYNWIKKGDLQASWLGSKKIFDLAEIFKQLETRKGKGG